MVVGTDYTEEGTNCSDGKGDLHVVFNVSSNVLVDIGAPFQTILVWNGVLYKRQNGWKKEIMRLALKRRQCRQIKRRQIGNHQREISAGKNVVLNEKLFILYQKNRAALFIQVCTFTMGHTAHSQLAVLFSSSEGS